MIKVKQTSQKGPFIVLERSCLGMWWTWLFSMDKFWALLGTNCMLREAQFIHKCSAVLLKGYYHGCPSETHLVGRLEDASILSWWFGSGEVWGGTAPSLPHLQATGWPTSLLPCVLATLWTLGPWHSQRGKLNLQGRSRVYANVPPDLLSQVAVIQSNM